MIAYIFEQANITKTRFPSTRGGFSVAYSHNSRVALDVSTKEIRDEIQ